MKKPLALLVLFICTITLTWYTVSQKENIPKEDFFAEPAPAEEEDGEEHHMLTQGNDNMITVLKAGTTVYRDTPHANNAGSFINIGPFGNPEVGSSATGNGAAQYIEMHPTEPGTMYLTTRCGGLFKTVNYGNHWEPFSDYFCTGAECVAISKSDTKVMYLGGSKGMMWITTDGGESWTYKNNGLPEKGVNDIEIDPTNSSRALAATGDGLYLTTDQGESWVMKNDYLITDLNCTSDWSYIAVTPNYSGNTYQKKAERIPSYFKSLDKGDTWEEVIVTTGIVSADSTNTVYKTWVAIHEPKDDSPLIIYTYLVKSYSATGFTSSFAGLYKSVDGDSSFQEVKNPAYDYPNGPSALSLKDGDLIELESGYGSVNPTSTGTWVGDFYVSPANPDVLMTLNCKMWGTYDGGLTWQMEASYGAEGWADRRYITNNITEDTIYYCDDGGVWAIALADVDPYDSSIKHLVEKNGDICGIEASDGDVSATNKRVFICGGQDIGQLFTRNGRDSHAGAVDCYKGRICPFNDSVFVTGGFIKITIEGRPEDEASSYKLYDDITYNPFDEKQVFGFTSKKTVDGVGSISFLLKSPKGENGWAVQGNKTEEAWSSANTYSALDSWRQAIDINAYGDVLKMATSDFEISRASEGLAYLAIKSGNRLFRTNDINSEVPTWVELSNVPTTTERYRLASHPKNENLVAIATEAAVYLSRDKGDTWEILKTLPTVWPPKNLVFDPNTEEGLYLAATTIYYTDETLDEWIEFNKGLPSDHTSRMQLQDYGEGDTRIFVTKYGRGMWESPTYQAEHNALPFPDFAIHGTYSDTVVVGESIGLADLTGNSEHIYWIVRHEDGELMDSIADVMFPKFTLPRSGNYTVSLTATNKNGTATKTRESFIYMSDRYEQIKDSYLYFDGTDDKVLWHDESVGEIGADSAITFSIWAKFHDTEATLTEYLMGKGNSNYGFQILRNKVYKIKVNLTNKNKKSVGLEFCPTLIEDSLYHHYALSIDVKNGIAEVYIDGQLEQRVTDEDKDIDDLDRIDTGFEFPTVLAVGYSIKDYKYYFEGCVDNFFIYNTALSNDKIQELYNKEVSEENLAHSYPMNDNTTPDNLYDQRGAGDAKLVGPIYGGGTLIPVIVEEEDHYLHFDGANDKVTWTNNDIGQIGANSEMSLSLWVKFANANANGVEHIISKRSTSSNGIQIFRYTDNKIGVNMKNSNGKAVGYGFGPTTISDTLFHHLALVINTELGTSQIYIDGNLEQNITDEGKSSTNLTKIAYGFNIPSPLTLGCNSKNNNYFFEGCMDDFFIYDSALSEDEVLDIYNKEAITVDATYSYRMNDAETTDTLYDQTNDQHAFITEAMYMPYIVSPTTPEEEEEVVIANSFLSFDGINDNVTWEDTNIGNVPQDEEITIAGWVKFNNANAKNVEFIFSKRSAQSNGIQIFRYTNNKIGVNLKNNNGKAVGYGYCPTAITDTLYHHFALVINTQDGTSEVYIDANLEQSISDENKSATNQTRIDAGFNIPTPLTLGYNTKSNNYYLDGCIDDFFIYNNALSPEEIQSLYYKDSIDTEVTYSFPMNDAETPNTLYDQSGSLHAVINGAIYGTYETEFDVAYKSTPALQDDVVLDNEITLYPNPCIGLLNIDTPFDAVIVKVYNLHGTVIKTEQLVQNQQLHIEQKGLFIIDIAHNDDHYTRTISVK